MPKTVSGSVLIVGSGPIVIGQACEFDYSGTQACRVLKQEGLRVVLVNSNPATIMTDPEVADRTYVEPITAEVVARILEVEQCDAILPTLGGQTALNVAMELSRSGTLERLGVRMLGATAEAIDKAEDRDLFRDTMRTAGIPLPRSGFASSIEEAETLGVEIGYPVILRPSFTLGGAGGGRALTKAELRAITTQALRLSPVGTVLVEEDLTGWKEFELEVMRDRKDNAVIVCGIENLDPMGVHTGDSITVAPIQTLTDREYQRLRDMSLEVLRAVGVDTGGSNVQFALNPDDGRIVVIEMNPRVSRSSALASKATGFPIAKIAAKLAIGYTLDEIANDITKVTPACFEPSLDYVVVKIPRFAFEKFPTTDDTLTTRMKSVGEVMAIGRTFPEAFLKAVTSLEIDRLPGLLSGDALTWISPDEVFSRLNTSAEPGEEPGTRGRGAGAAQNPESSNRLESETGHPPETDLRNRLRTPAEDTSGRGETSTPTGDPSVSRETPSLASLVLTLHRPVCDRMFRILQLMRDGADPANIHAVTRIDPWFLDHFAEIVYLEHRLSSELPELLRNLAAADARQLLRDVKRAGLPDARIAELTGTTEPKIRDLRKRLGVTPVFKAVDTCAAEFPAETPYFYSTYEEEDEGERLSEHSVVVLGSGPNRIGQGIEFDYCCVVAAQELRARGKPVIFINSNPETVSTDYDVSDRLYFEPLTREHVTNVLEKESPAGAVVQFGGQTPLKLAETVQEAGIPILGTSPESIEAAENREKFRNLLVQLDLVQPRSLIAQTPDEAQTLARELGYPVLARPSHVLGGRGMRVCEDARDLELLFAEGVPISKESPVLLDAFLEDAIELDVDAVCDGTTVIVGAVLEHLEEAGIHSGDSTCITPPYSTGADTEARIRETTTALARSLGVVGLMNVQYAVKGDTIYILEANPRASRTVPFVSKATGLPLVRLAVGAMLGEALPAESGALAEADRAICVKKAVLPFDRFPGEDTVLGPEMKSTGEVMGVGADFGEAFAKAELGAGVRLPDHGTVFLSVRDSDKRAVVFLAKRLVDLGFTLVATAGTSRFLERNGIPVTTVNKLDEGHPHAVDLVREGNVQLVLNSPRGRQSKADGKAIRAAALEVGVPCVTTLPGMIAVVSGIESLRGGTLHVRALQDLLAKAPAETIRS